MEIMAKKMLIDATHTEETRVVVVEGNKVEEFDFESENRRQLAGNIYLAKVTRIEPSLQAAFIDYGGNRHGFLAFSEIHPDYYQIPVADREALMAEERAYSEAMRRKDDEDEADEVVETDNLSEAEKLNTSEIEVNDESKENLGDDGKSKKKKSKVKSKPTKDKRKSSEETTAGKENSSNGQLNASEEKVEKKPRGRPKKSQKPIAAAIDTDSNDEVIQSDDLDGVDRIEKPNSEVSESKDLLNKKSRYRKRPRKKLMISLKLIRVPQLMKLIWIFLKLTSGWRMILKRKSRLFLK